ncbi:hypothetical protein J1605_018140 [Eschrichtius robustus]|uniref:Uncharacterized protein n=1 Tax=Eschrichtius robustus TaxID=9764 RepID=A0AB34HYK8_ESCRO|nr:hypothetical protein J1605_018140 [Eschrichtius robustus]
MQPQTPPSAQLLCVLSSARSDYLEVVHLLPVLRLSIFAFSPWAPELRRCHPLLTYSASGTLPDSVLSECWEAADPLGHLGTPTTTQGEALPLPGAGARRRGTSSACRCHVRLELIHGPVSRTGGLTSQRDGTSRVAACVSAFFVLTTASLSLFCLHSHNERRNTFLHPLTGQVPEENKKFDLKMYVYPLLAVWPFRP